MKPILPLLLLLTAPLLSMGQCDTLAIAKTDWSVTYVDSEELTGEGVNNGHAADFRTRSNWTSVLCMR